MRMQLTDIETLIKDLNIVNPGTPVYRAAVLMFSMMFNESRNYLDHAKHTGVPIAEVREIMGRWVKNGIYRDACIELEPWNDTQEMILQLTCISLCGAGELVRYQIPQKELPPPLPELEAPPPPIILNGSLPASLKPEELKFPYIPKR